MSLPFARSKHLLEAIPKTPLPGLILPVIFLQIPPLKAHTHTLSSVSRPSSDQIPLLCRGSYHTTRSPHRLFGLLSLSRPSTAMITCRVAVTIVRLRWLLGRRRICHQARRSVEPPSHYLCCWGRGQLSFDPPGPEQG